jgi:transcriptional regulator with XRE-family HTH domain
MQSELMRRPDHGQVGAHTSRDLMNVTNRSQDVETTDRGTADRPMRERSDAALSFGARLRAQRERRQVTIASIAESTKILGALLEGLEHGDVSRWPSGLYRRAFIRAYAVAIGLEPEPVVREFLERFPDPEELPAPSVIPPAASANGRAPWAVLRLTLAEGTPPLTGGHLIHEVQRRVGAVAIDALVLGAVSIGLFVVLGEFWAPLAITTVCYYVGSTLLLGNTPGVCLFASKGSAPHDWEWGSAIRRIAVAPVQPVADWLRGRRSAARSDRADHG